MNIISNTFNFDLIQTELCTIVEGNGILAPATTAILSIWATWNLAEVFEGVYLKSMDVVTYTSLGIAGLVLSIPLALQVAQKLSPESKEKLESSQNY